MAIRKKFEGIFMSYAFCIHVCMYIHLRVHVYVYLCAAACVCIYVYECMCICICAMLHVSTYVFIYDTRIYKCVEMF